MSNYIQSIAVFLIFSSIISIILPNKKYESYLKLFMGIIFIFIVIEPISSFINFGNINLDQLNFQTSQQNFESEIQNANIEQINNIILEYELILKETLRNIVEENSNFTVINSHFNIDVYYNFGEILAIFLQLQEKNINENRIPFISIENIRIDSQINSRGLPSNYIEIDDNEIIELKKLISNFYNLYIGHIFIYPS